MTAAPGPNVLLIRHGETTWSRSGQHTSRTDLPLTEAGEVEAVAVRRFVGGRRFFLVLCSPMARARRTAELAGLPNPEIDPDLREWDYGECEGQTTAELRSKVPGWTVWTHPCPAGETIEQVAGRADRVLGHVRECPPGSSVALVAHGHILRVLTARWLGTDPRAGRWLALGTATVSKLGWEHETEVIQQWNRPVEGE